MNEPTLIERLQDEADLCRNDHADDIATLLDEAVTAVSNGERAEAECNSMLKRLRDETEKRGVVLPGSPNLIDELVAQLEKAERERAEIERRYETARQNVELERQRIAVLTAVAVRAYEFRHTVLLTTERYAAQDRLDEALATAGIGNETVGKENQTG